MPNFRPTRVLACTLLFAATAQAQMHRVEAPEKVTRSVGVYEWTGDLAKPTAARLVPVSLFIEGQFQDGGTFYSRPIPLALLNGNIYSLEKAGLPQGTLTLDYARHLQSAAAGSDDTTNLGWFGYGTYATMPVEKKAHALQASATPPAIVSSKDDDRPTFIRRNADDSKTAGAPDDDAKPPSKTTAPTPASSPGTAPPDDDDRPHFSKPPAATPSHSPTTTTPDSTTKPGDSSKPADSSKPNDSSTKTTTTTRDPADDSDRPTLRHRDPKQAEEDRKAREKKHDQSYVRNMPGSLNDDPDRPNMRRGKTAGIGGDPAAQLTGTPVGLHQIVAVSDPATREPHPFAREWATPTERAEILTKLQAIAQDQLTTYARKNGAESAPATPAPAKPKPTTKTAARTHRPTPAHVAPAAPAPLTNEELTPYTLSYGGLPTFVYMAISPATNGPERYVTLVAQQLPSGELQVALATVTDAAHLDRTPWFRLIDAVDPDAEHRASILFELRGHSARQFALYRVLSAKAEQLFVTNPTD